METLTYPGTYYTFAVLLNFSFLSCGRIVKADSSGLG
jgi:hypothetical protein